jgi:hypothetical protein
MIGALMTTMNTERIIRLLVAATLAAAVASATAACGPNLRTDVQSQSGPVSVAPVHTSS